MAIRTSMFLRPTHVYTRAQLAEAFEIHDASLNNGIFQPRGHDSIWLFVTKEKTPDRVQYEDRLEGGVLTFPGQTEGRTDAKILNHAADGNELLLFYRERKYEFPGAGFRFVGAFRYVSHDYGRPAVFTLQQLANG